MTEIWSLDALCRCCHADGDFKDLRSVYMFDNTPENYLNMLLETLGVAIKPPTANASYSICDACIFELRNATNFKRKVLECESKFEEYCKNELSQDYDIKTEPEYLDDIDDNDFGDIEMKDVDKNPELKVTIKRPIKNIKKEKESDIIELEIPIDVKPKIEGKPKKKHKSAKSTVKGKPTKAKLKIKQEESLVVTVKTESGELYSCKNCGANYENIEELNRHINLEHFEGYKCMYCPDTFVNENRYRVHNRLQHNDTKPFVCEHCGRKVGSKQALHEHINSAHTKEVYYQCDVCYKKFHNKSVLRVHLKKHDGTFRKLICEVCGVGCNDITNLRYHVLAVHDKMRLFKCQTCDKKFSAAKHLRNHMRTHTGERPYECNICHLAFISNDALAVHKKRHDNSGYTCKTCAKVFPTRGLYASHYRRHVNAKPFKCHLCSKEFAGKYSLNRHVFEHTGARPFSCPLCKKDFKQKTQLVRHNKRFHDPNKAVVVKEKCDLCKRTVPNLEKHMLAHTNKPYPCHLCDKRYPEQNALNRHLQRHTGIKPHQCQLCDKAYIQLKSLRGHIMKVHKLPLKTEQEDHYDSVVTTYTLHNLKKGRSLDCT